MKIKPLNVNDCLVIELHRLMALGSEESITKRHTMTIRCGTREIERHEISEFDYEDLEVGDTLTKVFVRSDGS